MSAQAGAAPSASPSASTDAETVASVFISIDVVLGVVHVELAGRRDQSRILDDRLELSCLVIDHHDGAFLVLGRPDREPDLVATAVVFGLHDALGAVVLDARPFRDR